ncbi:DUF1275 family protein, partial [Paraburkholderia sp. 22099]|uniref:DUF1275 family protein n=1 Tax=Paraburkholderia sp. 22099 TaxID=3453875 RepID=UPI003F869E94
MKSEDTLLAGIAGFVDTLSFVALYGLFTAHVTGNFVLIGAGVGGYGQGILLKLAVNWLRVSLKRKRDVKKRCGVGAQERFEGCEKIEHYAIFSD